MKTRVILEYDSTTNGLALQADNLPEGGEQIVCLQRILLAAMNVVTDQLESKRKPLFMPFGRPLPANLRLGGG